MSKITIIVHTSAKRKPRIRQLEQQMADMQTAVDTLIGDVTNLTTQVAALATVVDNVVVFEQGQAAQIAALKDELAHAAVPPALIDKVLEIGKTIQSNADALGNSKQKLITASITNAVP